MSNVPLSRNVPETRAALDALEAHLRYSAHFQPADWLALKADILGHVSETNAHLERESHEVTKRMLDRAEEDAEKWRNWSKRILSLPDHNFPTAHTFAHLRDAMKGTS